MRAGWRTITGVLAIYAVALHVVLAGLMPVAAAAASADPLSVICHSVPAGSAGQQDTGVPQPGHRCCSSPCMAFPSEQTWAGAERRVGDPAPPRRPIGR